MSIYNYCGGIAAAIHHLLCNTVQKVKYRPVSTGEDTLPKKDCRPGMPLDLNAGIFFSTVFELKDIMASPAG